MDKYEYKIKSEEIKELIAKKRYAEAMAIADGIDWRRVKSVIMLCTVSDLYKINRKYEESKELLLLAYERHPAGRMIVYSLCELCIKMENPVEAIEYYKEFVQIAPKDSGRYILQYKLYESQEVSLEERIAVLEEFKKREYRPRWAYELAYLYHRVGLSTKCVEECDQLILSFGEGRYVVKAMELKMLHQPLTEDQEIKYALATGKVLTPEPEAVPEETRVMGELPVSEEAVPVMEEESVPEEPEIKVKPVNVGEYATINLERELAESMKDIFPPEENEEPAESVEPLPEEPVVTKAEVPAGMTEVSAEISEEIPEDTLEEAAEEEAVTEPVAEAVPAKREPDSEEIFFVEKDTTEIQQSQIAFMTQKQNEEKESEFNKILSQEYDGQISLVVPETGTVERQITGQMNIQDILNEWERMKKETEQKQEEDIKQKILQQTGALFTEFDVASVTGVLAQLEDIEESDNNAIAKIVDFNKMTSRKEPAAELPAEDVNAEEYTEEAYEDETAVSEEYAEEVYEDETAVSEEYTEETYEETDAVSEEYTEETYEEDVYEETVVPEEEPDEVEELAEIEPVPEDDGETEDSTDTDTPDTFEEEISDTEVYAKKLMAEDTDSDDAVRDVTVEMPKIPEPEQNGKLRALTDDEKELFATFIQTKETKKQLIEALDAISLAAYTGNVIITGEIGSGTLDLAKNLVKEVRQSDSNFSGKIAKISAKLLNKKDIEDTLGKLVNGALIIEKASELAPETVKKLNKALEQEKSGIIVILEDRKKEMNKFLESNHTILNNFNARIDVEALDNNALVTYGKKYAESPEYSIDEMGVLALYTRIADMQTSDHIVTVSDVKELVDSAIDSADRKNIKHLMDLLLAKRYDDEDMIILRERDFMS